MITRRCLLLMLFASVLVPGCGPSLPTYRYRLTVEVDTPEGLRTGSTVVEVRNSIGRRLDNLELAGPRSDYRGEAVTVDLGQRGTLFVLLDHTAPMNWGGGIAPSVLVPDNEPGVGSTASDWAEVVRRTPTVRHVAELPPNLYPGFVYFTDINDPRTVTEVAPDRLASVFGRGVRLRRMTLQITDDPITYTIRSRLPWWREYIDRNFDGTSSTVEVVGGELNERMAFGHFSTEGVR